jgi:ABC-type dipeptide/oligopeptide/nickel transport system permease subunit
MSFPPLLVLLLLVAALGGQKAVLMLGVVLVLSPGVARIARTATLEASVRGYVEAAVARGARRSYIITREIFPNIVPAILADLGIRCGWSVILVASVNYLGLGVQPPNADWGLMLSENRVILSENPWAIVVPCILLAGLTVAVNLVGDAYSRGGVGQIGARQ